MERYLKDILFDMQERILYIKKRIDIQNYFKNIRLDMDKSRKDINNSIYEIKELLN